jgi:hypothetical protein
VVTRRSTLALSHRLFYEICAEAVGVAKDNVVRVVRIQPDGSSKSTASFEVRAVGQEVRRVEHVYKIMQPGKAADPSRGLIEMIRPNGVHATKDAPATMPFTAHDGETRYIVHPECEEHAREKVVYSLKFAPPLPQGKTLRFDEPIRYESSPHSFCMTPDELSAASPRHKLGSEWLYEFSSLTVYYPCNRLMLQVVFPDGYKPGEPDFDVWYGEARLRHHRSMSIWIH